MGRDSPATASALECGWLLELVNAPVDAMYPGVFFLLVSLSAEFYMRITWTCVTCRVLLAPGGGREIMTRLDYIKVWDLRASGFGCAVTLFHLGHPPEEVCANLSLEKAESLARELATRHQCKWSTSAGC